MSMEHKAFVFDYEAFIAQFSDLLENSLYSERIEDIVNFIQENLSYLKDPYEGEPLDYNWENQVQEIKDVHIYADFALTKFYNPDKNIGLVYNWQNIENTLIDELDELLVEPREIILGKPFGSTNNWFDPGRMGSYFQSPEHVKHNMQILQNLLAQKPELSVALADLLSMLQTAINSQKGLYTTF
jgi:hypothetical protein